MRMFTEITGATLLVVAALFPIVNPLGSSLIFLGLTDGYTAPVRNVLARKIGLNSFILLTISMLIGTRVLAFFGISLPVVQVGGGMVVIAMGWNMLQRNESEPGKNQPDPRNATEQAFYPLTLPLTVGPGSLSVAVALGANSHRQMYSWPAQLTSALLGPLLLGLSVWICYRSAERLERLLGPSGLGVFIRLSAFIVLCIGIQILWNGLHALLH